MSEPKMKSNVSKLRPSDGSFRNRLGMLMDMWQTRFLVLRDGHQLAYYKDEKAFKAGSNPRGVIDVLGATVFNQSEDRKKYEVTIRTPGRDYRFRFQTAQLLQQWCDALATHENVQTVQTKLKQEIIPKFQITSNVPLPNATTVTGNNSSMLSAGSTVPDAHDSAPSTPPDAFPATPPNAQRGVDITSEPASAKAGEFSDPEEEEEEEWHNDPIRITRRGVRTAPEEEEEWHNDPIRITHRGVRTAPEEEEGYNDPIRITHNGLKKDAKPDPEEECNDPIRITYNGVPQESGGMTPRSAQNFKNMMLPKISFGGSGKFGGMFGSSGKFGASSKSLGSSKSLLTKETAGEVELPEDMGIERLPTLKGRLCGIGIVFRPQPNGELKVRKLLEGSSAAEGGQIRIGDILIGVDDLVITHSTSPEEVSRMVLGEEGKEVVLRLLRRHKDGSEEEAEARVIRMIPAQAQPTILSNPWKTSVEQHQYLNLVDAAIEPDKSPIAVSGAPIEDEWAEGDEYLVPV